MRYDEHASKVDGEWQVIGQFAGREFYQVHLPAIERCSSTLKDLTATSWPVPRRTLFNRRIWIAERSGLCSLYLNAELVRPVRYALAQFSKNGEILLPGFRTEDVFEVASILQLRSPVEISALLAYVRHDYGFVEQASPPTRLVSPKDLLFHRIDVPIDVMEYCADHRTLWWQKWGGLLYEIEWRPNERRCEIVELARYVGDYEGLPVSVRR